ncbi:hypothetical protein ED208_02095 [Stagnimonas aquatica]|uniref:Uncharacterized protein n=1 Tax=Stagnimonas aquatica TaxID=2689987 RepID=A0A3N0VKP6_9GAMM|nr:hypothetical protein [Stagnimonas aquatica]ROH93336.1 hypothetical protein ED208_02095 [Stagnimonas aquatica]
MPSWRGLPLLAVLLLTACAESLPPETTPAPTAPPTGAQQPLRRAPAHNDDEHARLRISDN